MDIIQQIGSYAGLAAVVGLAVLSALYFSMARDVKRLREWAGRAPERVAVPYQPPQRVVAQPVRQPTQPAAPPRPPVPPGATPVPRPAAQPAAAGAGPAVATGPLAATPAAARAAGSASAEAALQNTVAHPPPPPPRQALPPRPMPPGLGGHFAREAQIARAREEAERVDREGAAAQPDEDEAAGDHASEDERTDGGQLPPEAQAPQPEQEAEEEEDHEAVDEGEPDSSPVAEEADAAREGESHEFAGLPDPEVFHEGDDLVGDPDTGEQRPAAPPPPPPITATRTPLPPRAAPPPRSAQPPILPPYEQGRPGTAGWEERKLSRTTAALAVGGTVIVVAAAAFGVLQLTGEEDGAGEPARTSKPAEDDTPAKEKPAKAAVDPRTVTVSVLNGTTVGGLAAKLGDKLEGQGFQLGNVTNNTDQQRAESVVLFAPGAEEEAADVSRRLKIDQRERIDPDSQTRAGDATVVVVAGLDLDR